MSKRVYHPIEPGDLKSLIVHRYVRAFILEKTGVDIAHKYYQKNLYKGSRVGRG